MHSHIPPKKFLSMKGLKKLCLCQNDHTPTQKSNGPLFREASHEENKKIGCYLEFPCVSVSNVQNVQYENEFYLHENEAVRGTTFHMNVFF